MNAETKPKKKIRNRNWVEFSVIEDAKTRLDFKTDVAMSKAMGYSGNVLNKWRENGLAPTTAALAAEALVRRAGPTAKQEDQAVVALVRGGRVMSANVWSGLGEVTLNGQVYLLVPKPKDNK